MQSLSQPSSQSLSSSDQLEELFQQQIEIKHQLDSLEAQKQAIIQRCNELVSTGEIPRESIKCKGWIFYPKATKKTYEFTELGAANLAIKEKAHDAAKTEYFAQRAELAAAKDRQVAYGNGTLTAQDTWILQQSKTSSKQADDDLFRHKLKVAEKKILDPRHHFETVVVPFDPPW